MSSNARASRSASRYSSPAHPPHATATGGLNGSLEGGSKGPANEGSRAFMARWLEPSVQAKPSFEEAGLMRYGVLETMAPLGAMPKPKKPAGETGGTVVRKIILRPSGSAANASSSATITAAAAAAAAAPATTAAQDDPKPDSQRAQQQSPPTSPPPPPVSPVQVAPAPSRRKSLPAAKVVEAEDDDDYDPKGEKARRRRSKRVSMPARKARRGSVIMAKTETPVRSTPKKRPARVDPEDRAFTDKVVEAAVDEALKHYRYPTAWALRTLYDERCDEAEFVAMVEDVFKQTADAETMQEFSRLLEEKKREGKRDNQGCYYFVPPTTNSRFTPHKPKPAPYAGLLRNGGDDDSAAAETTPGAGEATAAATPGAGERRAAKKAKFSHTSADAITGTASATAPATTPRKAGSASKVGAVVNVRTPRSSRRKRHARRESGSSISSLSSAMSLSSPEMGAASVRGAMAATVTARTKIKIPRSTTASAATGPRAASGQQRRTGRHRGRGNDGDEDGNGNIATTNGDDDYDVIQNSPSLKLRRGAAGGVAGAATTPGPAGPQSHHHADAPKSQPITTRGKTLASSKQHAVSNASESNSPTLPPHHRSSGRTRSHRTPAVDDASTMPGRLTTSYASELFPNLPVKAASSSTKAAQNPAKDPMHGAEDDDPFWDRRRDARRVTNGYAAQESAVRGSQEEAAVATPVRTTRKTRQSLAAAAAPPSTRATRSASKRPAEDVVERTDSPAAFSWQGDGGSVLGSRAATPTTLRPAKKQRTGLRVKSSPVKKKGGTAAGVPRSLGEANATLNNGAPKDSTSDNDEYCSACGNAGDVVCCDGCPRSFHFECVDMVPSEDLPDEWYCNECLIRRFPSRVPVHKGIFASALNNLEKSIPRAFSLPKRVQNRFEGVKAGADGDYEDVVVNRTAKKRNGYDELPDFFKQREDGQAVLCHACQKPATEIRSIIPCSACPLYWHIDCLDPPLAVPPVLKTWRCPAHVDDILIEVPSLAPAHRFRKVKAAQAIAPALSRGLKNNGHIEIEWSEEADDADDSGWPDAQSFGRTYKLPAKGVVLDFIEQLRHQGAGYGSRRNESKRVPYPSPPTQRDSSCPLPGSALERKVEEMQVSLNLIGLQQKRSDGINQLTSALLSATDQSVLSLMAKANADNIASGNLTDDDKQGLRATLAQMEAMSARIRQVLGDDKPLHDNAAGAADARTPVSEPPGIHESSEKLEQLPPVTEPTPPSTIDHAEGSMDLD
ncbi:hypothetical protein PLIIFM63780_001010 [Purpureocillium lilacinum]|nr:hypothetical protein PLIIFM63780_001010 [Purpureocillium lilacinum]